MVITKILKVATVCSYIIAFDAIAQQQDAPAVFQAQAGYQPQAAEPVPGAAGVPAAPIPGAEGTSGAAAVVPPAAPGLQAPAQAPGAAAATSNLNAPQEGGGAFAGVSEANSNPFLQFYTRQGVDVSVKVFYQNGKKLSLPKDISQDNLRKAIVIFFGDWCPHCDSFLKAFAANLKVLRAHEKEIKSNETDVIFVSVPSLEVLKNWRLPNVDEYNIAENKISAYGIELAYKNTNVVMLGDKSTLAKNGVEGLPVAFVVKDGKEIFRTTGDKAATDLNFNDPAVLKNFLEIFDEEAKEKKDSNSKSATEKRSVKSEKAVGGKHKVKGNGKNKKSNSKKLSKNIVNKHIKLSKSNSVKAREATKILNSLPS